MTNNSQNKSYFEKLAHYFEKHSLLWVLEHLIILEKTTIHKPQTHLGEIQSHKSTYVEFLGLKEDVPSPRGTHPLTRCWSLSRWTTRAVHSPIGTRSGDVLLSRSRHSAALCFTLSMLSLNTHKIQNISYRNSKGTCVVATGVYLRAASVSKTTKLQRQNRWSPGLVLWISSQYSLVLLSSNAVQHNLENHCLTATDSQTNITRGEWQRAGASAPDQNRLFLDQKLHPSSFMEIWLVILSLFLIYKPDLKLPFFGRGKRKEDPASEAS